jgi:hypothetical protein
LRVTVGKVAEDLLRLLADAHGVGVRASSAARHRKRHASSMGVIHQD